MSNHLKTNDAISTESLTEYELMMQLSNELAQKTDEVVALEEEKAQLLEQLEKTNQDLAEAHEQNETLIKLLANECDPIEDESEIEQAETSPAHSKTFKIILIVAATIAVIIIGVIASVVTFSLLYDMELTAAAATLAEGIMTLIS